MKTRSLLVGLAIGTAVTSGCTPLAPGLTPTLPPTHLSLFCSTPTSGRRFDARTEAYLCLLSQTPTGAALVHFARTNTAVEVAISWTTFAQEMGATGMVLTEGEILLAANLLADPSAGKVALEEAISGASVVAHEIAHVVLGDYSFPQRPYPAKIGEPPAVLVQAKVLAELVALFRGEPVDYYAFLPEGLLPEPWKLAGEIQALGIHPVDSALAQQLLWLPEPQTSAPVATPVTHTADR